MLFLILSVSLQVDEDVALDQAVKFCQIQMAASAQRQVGRTDSRCLTPGNNTGCFSLWNVNPIFSPLLTPLETQQTHGMFSHLAVVLLPLLPLSLSFRFLSPIPPTHTHSVFSEPFLRCINYACTFCQYPSFPLTVQMIKTFVEQHKERNRGCVW